MTIAWVLGSGGLLGAALCRQLRRSGTELFFPSVRLAWNGGGALSAQLAGAAISEFAMAAARRS